MFGLLRLAVVGFLVLTVIYVILSLYSRAMRRRKLLAEWEATGQPGDRDTFLQEGLHDYDDSLRRKLILGVYVVPVVVVTTIIYLTNFH